MIGALHELVSNVPQLEGFAFQLFNMTQDKETLGGKIQDAYGILKQMV